MRYYYIDGLFYQTEGDIPAGAIELTEEDLVYFDNAQANGAELVVIDGKLTVKEPEPLRIWWHDGGFYRSDIHGAMPEGAIEITEAQWSALLEAQSTGRQIVAVDGEVTTVEPDTLLTDEEKYERAATQIRSQRDNLLAETDYLIMPDYPITEAQSAAVRAYRQVLRDITTQDGFPFDVTWPEKPMNI